MYRIKSLKTHLNFHSLLGTGEPTAWHVKTTLSPGTVTMLSPKSIIRAGTERSFVFLNIEIHFKQS